MWYLELYCYTYNLTGIVFCVLLVTFVLGTIACQNDQFLKFKKRWQQILARLAFVEAIFATIFFAYPKVSSNSDIAIIPAAFAAGLFAIFCFSVMTFWLGMFFTKLIKWVFARAES